MLAADLIVGARRRAGLTQKQLAARTGRPQSTVARWERGSQVPSIDTTRAIVRACGLELTVGLARYDDSYFSLIDERLAMTPFERLASLCRREFEPLPILLAFARSGVRYALIGRAGAALLGSPLIVSPSELVLVPADDPGNRLALELCLGVLEAQAAPHEDRYAGLHTIEPWLLADGGRIALVPRPAGTRGYADLRRHATTIALYRRRRRRGRVTPRPGSHRRGVTLARRSRRHRRAARDARAGRDEDDRGARTTEPGRDHRFVAAPPNLEPSGTQEILDALRRHRVRYVLVGGLAAQWTRSRCRGARS